MSDYENDNENDYNLLYDEIFRDGVFIPGVYEEGNMQEGLFIPFNGGKLYNSDNFQLIDKETGNILQINNKQSKVLNESYNKEAKLLEEKENRLMLKDDNVIEYSQDFDVFKIVLSSLLNTLRQKYKIGNVEIQDNLFKTEKYILALDEENKELQVLYAENEVDPIFASDLIILISPICYDNDVIIRAQGYYRLKEEK